MLYRNYIKPPLDIFTAIVAFIVFSPIFFTVLIILLFYNNGKPFYYHHRPGKNEKVFPLGSQIIVWPKICWIDVMLNTVGFKISKNGFIFE
uniref:sugar transferase n=1 Tax=Gelidibacter sp. TaxID=2018083 RepID=UPI004049A4BB